MTVAPDPAVVEPADSVSPRPLARQHQRVLLVREEVVEVRVAGAEQRLVVDVGHADEIERRREAGSLGPPQHLAARLAVQAGHQRRAPDVQEPRPLDDRPVQVLGPELRVRADDVERRTFAVGTDGQHRGRCGHRRVDGDAGDVDALLGHLAGEPAAQLIVAHDGEGGDPHAQPARGPRPYRQPCPRPSCGSRRGALRPCPSGTAGTGRPRISTMWMPMVMTSGRCSLVTFPIPS